MAASRGIYKPIRVLFNTPIYDTAVKICWHLPGYRAQIAMMMEFLRLQEENLIPPNITAEDLRDLLVEKSKETLREQLWEFELEDFEEEEAKPLLKLVWAVNVINKMRDIEFQARMLLKFPLAIPPKFQTAKLLSMVKDYIKILKEKQQEPQSTKLLTAQEVVIEVVPRVLQGLWELPPRPLLNMASQSLSILSTSVTKATLDRVSKNLTAMESQAIFSRSIRDDMVQSILTEIREKYSQEILFNNIANFAPVLLKTIADVAKNHISEIFKPSSSLPMLDVLLIEEPLSESPPRSDVLPNEELPSESLPMSDSLPSEGPPFESLPVPNVTQVKECPSEILPISDVLPSEELPFENLQMSDVLSSEEPPSESLSMPEVPLVDESPSETLPVSCSLSNEEPPSDSLSMPDVPPAEESLSENVPMSDVLPSEELLSGSLPVPDVPCEELSAMSEPAVSVNSITEKSEDLKIKKKKKKKGFFQKVKTLCCCCVRPKETD